MSNQNKTLSVSVMSGKGGVGKTNISLSLGYALHKTGNSLLLLDCDLGLANLDVLLGISPDRNLQDLLRPEVKPADVVVTIEKGGFDFLPAASGVPELVEMDEDMQDHRITSYNVCYTKLLRLPIRAVIGVLPSFVFHSQ